MRTRTVYVPRLIESAEQAEALTIGTIALLPFGYRTKTTGGWWETPTGGGLDESRAVVGAQALVPIEARRQEPTDIIDPDFERVPSPRAHRYCTSWMEEA